MLTAAAATTAHASTSHRAVTELISSAPLTLVPIRVLATIADRATLDGWFAAWEQLGMLRVVPHLDAVYVPDRGVFAPAAA